MYCDTVATDRLLDLLASLKQQIKTFKPTNPPKLVDCLRNMSELRRLMRSQVNQVEMIQAKTTINEQEMQSKRKLLKGLQKQRDMLQALIIENQVTMVEIDDEIRKEIVPECWEENLQHTEQRVQQWVKNAKMREQLLANKKLDKQKIAKNYARKKLLYTEQLRHLTPMIDSFTKKVSDTMKIVLPIDRLTKIRDYFLQYKNPNVLSATFEDCALIVSILLGFTEVSNTLKAILPGVDLEPKKYKIVFTAEGQHLLIHTLDTIFTSYQLFNRVVSQLSVTAQKSKLPEQSTWQSRTFAILLKQMEPVLFAVPIQKFLQKLRQRVLSLLINHYLFSELTNNRLWKSIPYSGVAITEALKKINVTALNESQTIEHFILMKPVWLESQTLVTSALKKSRQILLKVYNQAKQKPEQRFFRCWKIKFDFAFLLEVQFAVVVPYQFPTALSVFKVIDIKHKFTEEFNNLFSIHKIEESINLIKDKWLDGNKRLCMILGQLLHMARVLDSEYQRLIMTQFKNGEGKPNTTNQNTQA